MSDVEEPPTKMSKYEEYLEPEPEGEDVMEEGQEEWLSEGVLTDDDYVQTTKQVDTDHALTIDQETTQSNETEAMQTSTADTADDTSNMTQNIEEQLNNMDSTNNGDELPDDLDAFLIRKTDGHVVEAKLQDETDIPKAKPEEDDGNDTDDLLRMLGDGDQKAKKKTFKIIKADKDEDQASTDDDDFIYEQSQVKTLKLAKNALIKRTATKAVPEDMSDGDDETEQSTDEGSTVQRMFEVKKSGSKSDSQKKVVKHVRANNNNSLNRSQKSDTKSNKPTFKNHKSVKPTVIHKKSLEVETPAPFKPLEKEKSKEKVSKSEVKNDDFDEIIDEEEFLDDDEYELDEEEFAEGSEGEDSKKQRIMKPEMMDEEVPSDAESRSEDGSLYDELPSSDSDDLDDWFTLDIRAERASDYLPLLGTKAKELLLAERKRVSARVATLRQSLSALTDSARRQADQLRAAAMALAEIDDTLKAA
ncbi:otolith matrix protein OMM-64 [Helicoverpa armigera]|uniref:otolith matrix protein OMM-64 n=1 Tax=Helicoverpa armigera TaxID=29058 RepID=UPI0030828B74